MQGSETRFRRPEPWDAGLDLAAATIVGALGPSAADSSAGRVIADRAIADRVIEVVRRFGFALIRSSPIAPDEIDRRRGELLALAAGLGTPVIQSPRGELVEDVKDFSDVEQDDRGYRSRGELSPHSDPPTLIVLHCVRPARSGGESSLVSVAAIVERLLTESPGAVDRLMTPRPAWRVAGMHGIATAGPAADPMPVLAVDDGVLSCVYYRPYVELAAHTVGEPMSGVDVDAFDRFDRWSHAPELTKRFVLEPGDTLVLHNRSVLHARTDYEDWPEPELRRHLLRVWVDAPDAFPVHPAHRMGDLFAVRR